jgi:hypothetical protein
MYAYHIIKLDSNGKSNLIGNSVLPLNKLKQIDLEIFEKYSQKYNGRTDSQNIVWNPNHGNQFNLGNDILMWGDVCFFTLHNPKLVFDFFKENNLPHRKGVHAFKIPIEKFSGKGVIWKYNYPIKNNLVDLDDCIPITAFDKIDVFELPENAKLYYLSVLDPQKRLLFKYIPHVLTPDSIKVSDCEIIQVS